MENKQSKYVRHNQPWTPSPCMHPHAFFMTSPSTYLRAHFIDGPLVITWFRVQYDQYFLSFSSIFSQNIAYIVNSSFITRIPKTRKNWNFKKLV